MGDSARGPGHPKTERSLTSWYAMRLAAVVPDPTVPSEPFQAFVRESNQGGRFRFFPTRWEALEWLQAVD